MRVRVRVGAHREQAAHHEPDDVEERHRGHRTPQARLVGRVHGAELVVLVALRRVLEHLVRALIADELLRRLRVVWPLVRVMLERDLPVRLLRV